MSPTILADVNIRRDAHTDQVLETEVATALESHLQTLDTSRANSIRKVVESWKKHASKRHWPVYPVLNEAIIDYA